MKTPYFRQLAIFFNRINLFKKTVKNNPTQSEIGQPSDDFSENPVAIKIPLGLLHRGVDSDLSGGQHYPAFEQLGPDILLYTQTRLILGKPF